MKVRDVKLGVVNEALQGIKQIKWTATEEQWQAKIGRVRGREIREIWSALVNDTGLFLCWTASPIMLSAASLGVYAILHGGLSPSVAFTSIGIFKQVRNVVNGSNVQSNLLLARSNSVSHSRNDNRYY